jgi:RNA polymerase sigma-70 factor (ECF subfamily)
MFDANATETPTARLLTLVADGDRQAFDELHGRFARAVLAAARRLLGERAAAEDATQLAFLKIWRNAHRFDASRGPAESWIFLVARGAAIDVARRRSRLVPVDDVDERCEAADAPPLADALDVRGAVARLPAALREVIELAYWQGLAQSEIAACTGAPLGTVKTRTRKALSLLAAQLAA